MRVFSSFENFRRLQATVKGIESEINPIVLTSRVSVTIVLEPTNDVVLCARFLYLFLLNSLEASRFVSWHTVNCKTVIELASAIARSGLNDLNKSLTGRVEVSSRSLYSNCPGRMWLPIQPASIDKILLCLVVYLSRATGDSQLERTCLLVWGLFEWHKAHMGSEILSHLARFAPVADR